MRVQLLTFILLACCAPSGWGCDTDDKPSTSVSTDPKAGALFTNSPEAGVPPEKSPKKLKLTLNSTPSKAIVTVNGNEVGTTPMILELEDHGKPTEFVYKLDGYQSVTKNELLVRDGEVHGVFGKKMK